MTPGPSSKHFAKSVSVAWLLFERSLTLKLSSFFDLLDTHPLVCRLLVGLVVPPQREAPIPPTWPVQAIVVLVVATAATLSQSELPEAQLTLSAILPVSEEELPLLFFHSTPTIR